jgi:hypothetical protein
MVERHSEPVAEDGVVTAAAATRGAGGVHDPKGRAARVL